MLSYHFLKELWIIGIKIKILKLEPKRVIFKRNYRINLIISKASDNNSSVTIPDIMTQEFCDLLYLFKCHPRVITITSLTFLVSLLRLLSDHCVHW